MDIHGKQLKSGSQGYNLSTRKLEFHNGKPLYLYDVLYAPKIRQNLVSVTILLSLDYALNFHRNNLNIYLNSFQIGTGYLLNGFMLLDTGFNSINNDSSFSFISASDNINIDVYTWHARLGHIGQDRMSRLAKEGLLG